MRQNFYDSSNRKLGYTEQSGTKINLYSPSNTKLGYYDTSTNRTYTPSNTPVGSGNLLGTLL